MTGRVLIVDPVVTSRIVLKVKLAAAYYSVRHAATLEEARKCIPDFAPHLILVDHMLPDGDASTLYKDLTGKQPLCVALLPDAQSGLAAQYLQAGFDDIICRPYHESVLLARVRHLMRRQSARDHLVMQRDTSQALGFAERPVNFETRARIAILAETPRQARTWGQELNAACSDRFITLSATDIIEDLQGDRPPEGLIFSLNLENARKRLDLIGAIRTQARASETAVLVVLDADLQELAGKALDVGADDILVDGFRTDEILIRIKRCLRTCAEDAWMRRSLRAGLEAAVTDPLTGLYNRRYALPYVDRITSSDAPPMALMLLDLDHFKRVNDRYGHAVGDVVLKEFAQRMLSSVRPGDLVARIGGEEFLVALPGTTIEDAVQMGERLRHFTMSQPFATQLVPYGVTLSVSVGLALSNTPDGPNGSATGLTQLLMKQADKALYQAKETGRNKVHVNQSAA